MTIVLALICFIGYFICFGITVARSDNSRRQLPVIALLVLIPYSCAAAFLWIVSYMTGSAGAALFACSAVITCIYIFGRIISLRRAGAFRGGVVFVMVVYVLLVLSVTLLSREAGSSSVVQMQIGHFLTAYRQSGDVRNTILHAAENVAMFVPLGVLFPLLRKDRPAGFWATAGSGVTLSFLIEFLQLQLHCGHCDIDDILMNTAGTVIGYLICRITLLFMEPEI